MKESFLHICLSESWGGLEMAVSKWNEVLKQNGHLNLNICTPDSPLAEDLKSKNFPVLEWDSAHYFSPDFTYKLRKLILEKKIDYILLQNLRDLWIVSPALYNVKNCRLIGFAQMLISIKKQDFLHRLIYKPLSHVMTLTDWQQQALAPFLPIPMEKYKTIPNFVDCNVFHPKLYSDDYRYQLGFTKDHFLIGVIGRIDEQKGQMEMVEAFAKIKDEYKNAHLVIIGEPTLGEPKQEAYFKKLQSYVNRHRLESRVHFKGFQKDPNKLFANFDLFVLPSHRETFGFVVVESMASGTLVLGTNAGGVPEILGQGEYGYLCEPKNADDLAMKLVHILQNPEERKLKADKALQRVRSFYDRQKVYSRFMNIIQ